MQKARKEEFLHVANNSGKGIQNQRRLSIRFEISKEIVDKCASVSPIRSILYFHWYIASLSFLRGYRLLRVLDLLEASLDSLRPEITQLFHLRFLALGLDCPKLSNRLKVPPSISKLQNLQTLMIRADAILLLPIEIWEMPQLRHLIFFQERGLPSPLDAAPSGGHVLENLQTLRVDNFRFTSTAIETMPNLKKLKVYYYHLFVAVWTEYCLSNLVHLCQLETLNLLFINSLIYKENPLPASFALSPNLKKLTLSGCTIPWRHMTVIVSLPNLEVLKLRDNAFIGREWECSSSEEGFPRLKFLLLEGLHLRRWRVVESSSFFPCLERLTIGRCWTLEEIPCEIGDIPTLALIEVGPGRQIVADSALRIQEEQRSLGNDLLQVRIRF